MSVILLASALACAHQPTATEAPATEAPATEAPAAADPAAAGASSVERSDFAPTPGGATITDAPVSDWYPQAPAELEGCTVSGQTGIALVLQISCPDNRVLTDMRGPGVPDPGSAVDTTMQTLAGLGLQSSPRQAMQDLPTAAEGEPAPAAATIIDASGQDLQMTVWVVHHMGNMPQVLTCMAEASDQEATTWCPTALAGMLLPPAAEIPGLRFMELRLEDEDAAEEDAAEEDAAEEDAAQDDAAEE